LASGRYCSSFWAASICAPRKCRHSASSLSPIIIPGIALFIRRLHDINQTGWIYLGLVAANFVPVLNMIAGIAAIVIACIPGTKGPNKYGPDPLNPTAGAADTFV
jgi:hypothetical protein